MKNVTLVIGGAKVAAIVVGSDVFMSVTDLLTRKGVSANVVNEFLPKTNFDANDLVSANAVNNELAQLETEYNELFNTHDTKVKQLRVLKQQKSKVTDAGKQVLYQSDISRVNIEVNMLSDRMKEIEKRMQNLRDALATLNTSSNIIDADEFDVL